MKASWDEGAEVYARVMAPILADARRSLLEAPAFTSLETALDVGSGPGFLLQEMRESHPGVVLLGVDLSHRMLSLVPKGFPVACMDAERLGFRSSSFDAVFMSYVLTAFPNPIACLTEARRVLRLGGALGVATWQPREGEALHRWVAALDNAGAEPVEDLRERANTAAKVTALLEVSGFTDTECWTTEFSFVVDPKDFIELRSKLGMSAERLNSIPPIRRRELLRDFERRLSELTLEQRTEGGIAVLATSRAPT